MRNNDQTAEKDRIIGFVGLGDMGGPIAANIAKGGFDMLVFDKAGTASRAPDGADHADNVEYIAENAETLFLCVPNGEASHSICEQIRSVKQRRTTVVIDLSTTGVASSAALGAELANDGIIYIDSPVSGGRAGATAGTITVIWGGPADCLEAHRSVLAAMSGNVFHVGNEAGKGQAMKLLNNFLSATAMAATSEAVIYGLSQGLEFNTIIDVLNVSTGMNTATLDKFPNRIGTGSYDAGFRSALMHKDIRLYCEGVANAGTPTAISDVVKSTWQEVDEQRPESDISEVFRFLRGEDG